MSFIQFGRRIYYSLADGSFIFDTGEYSGWGYSEKPSVEDDFAKYEELSPYKLAEVDYIDLEYGQFSEDFINCLSFRVNTFTKEIEFSFLENKYEAPLSIQVSELKQDNEDLKARLVSTEEALLEFILGGM